ncbi:hypothetical protein JCM8097_002468 [Rhodosporidiobolus ruineniae]
MAWLSGLLSCLPSTRPAPPSLTSSSRPPHQPSTPPRQPPRALQLQPTQQQQLIQIRAVRGRSDYEARQRAQLWKEWEQDYASGKYDLEKCTPPPFHPVQAGLPSGQQPLQPDPFLFPPYSPRPPPQAPLQQRTLNKLDVRGKRRPPPLNLHLTSTPPPRPRKSSKRLTSTSLARPATPASPPVPFPTPPLTPPRTATPRPAPPLRSLTSDSLVQHPLCRDIVAESLDAFDTSSAILAVLDDDRMVFLASSGVEQDPESIPRQASFCTHTVLSRDRSFVVLDSLKDWRFANNYLVVKHNVRFYAGAQVVASSDLRNPNAAKVAIGTLCVTDTAPRALFSSDDRDKLTALAASASTSIEAWARARLPYKEARLDRAFESWKAALPPLPTLSSSEPGPSVFAGSRASLPGASSTAAPAPARSRPSSGPRKKPSLLTLPSSPSSSDPHSSSLCLEAQRALDSATRTIADALDVPLVEGGRGGVREPGRGPLLHLALLSSTSPSSPPPSSSPERERKKAGGVYDGGILLSIPLPSSPSSTSAPADTNKEKGGAILAVFKRDPKRVWGREELAFLRRFLGGEEGGGGGLGAYLR